jgi:hypothetical protein
VSTFEEVKARASLRTSSVVLCLDGAAEGRIEELEAELAATPAPTSLADGTRAQLAEQILALVEQMRESNVTFRLRALPARRWQDLVDEQPERVETDTAVVWRGKIFPWYCQMVALTCTDPAMTVEQVDELADVLHQGSWSVLVLACLELNGGRLDVPNFDAASAATRTSEQT